MRKKPTGSSLALARADKATAADRSRKTQRQIDRLSSRFLELRQQLARDAVESMREMGRVLQQARALLDRDYGRWIEDELGISRAAGSNYERVYELSQTTPRLFIDHKELGASKMIRLARVVPKMRAVVLKQKTAKKTTADMTDAEFALITKPYLQRPRKISGNMKAHGLRMKLRALTQTLRTATRYPKITDANMRKRLIADLKATAVAANSLARKLCV